MKIKKQKVGRPKQGKTVKKHYSIRLESLIRKNIAKDFSTLQSAIDSFIPEKYKREN